MNHLQQNALKIFDAAIDSVKPERLIASQVSWDGSLLIIQNDAIDLSNIRNLYVIGAGKASAFMAAALEKILGDRIHDGLVIVKYEHGTDCRKIRIREAGHPVLDANAISATEEMCALLSQTGPDDLVICLISGGGSALMEKLPEDISLEDLQTTFSALLKCGATIDEFNILRKHLSAIKGGQLARKIAPARGICLMISDVIGDDPATIASGPTAPDSSTFQEARAIVNKYSLEGVLPAAILLHLAVGSAGNIPETPKPGDPAFQRMENRILGSNYRALETAEDAAASLGYNTTILSSRVAGEAREVAHVITAIAREIAERDKPLAKPAALIFGGETTVTLKGDGKGGRNQELVLAALDSLADFDVAYAFLCCGSDGNDGPTDAAGAVISRDSWPAAQEKNISPREFLERNDAYHFFKVIDGLVITGPTGTNVMDIGVLLIE